MNRKTIFITTLVLLVTGTLTAFLIFKPLNKADKEYAMADGQRFDPGKTYYWFLINVRYNSKSDSFMLGGSMGGIKHGTYKDFSKDLWKSLSRQTLAVGPFENKTNAKYSKKLYQKTRDRVPQAAIDSMSGTYYYFEVTFSVTPRSNYYVLRHSPAMVTPATGKQFVEALYYGLTQKKVMIGLFGDQALADDAKRLYRKNEGFR